MRRNAERQLAAAESPGDEPPEAEDRSAGEPPWSRARATSSASRPSTGPCADSTPSTSTLPPPPEATPDRAASPGSSRRQLAGCSPDCAMARTASTASGNRSNTTEAEALWEGRSWSRIHASVMTPRVPSEPRNNRSGEGPAPEPGTRSDWPTPEGVTTRRDSTRSSMWVWRVA